MYHNVWVSSHSPYCHGKSIYSSKYIDFSSKDQPGIRITCWTCRNTCEDGTRCGKTTTASITWNNKTCKFHNCTKCLCVKRALHTVLFCIIFCIILCMPVSSFFLNVSLRRPCSLQDFFIICQQIGRKSASRGVGKKGLWDEAIHADLIRRLHNMEQVSQQHTVHIHTLNSNMPPKSHSQTPSFFVICQVPI